MVHCQGLSLRAGVGRDAQLLGVGNRTFGAFLKIQTVKLSSIAIILRTQCSKAKRFHQAGLHLAAILQRTWWKERIVEAIWGALIAGASRAKLTGGEREEVVRCD